MGIFHRNHPTDVLFLMPVRLADEKLPKGKVRMLYCDAAGRVYTSSISRSVYELARDNAERMERSHKYYATLGLEIGPGQFIPAAVEIGATEVWALERILEHALRNGRLPDILKKYLTPIIQLGEANREAVLSKHRKRRHPVPPEAIPRVLNRLPYYSENDIEISMPIYKAEYRYPLIVMKRLPADEHTPHSVQKLLILDSDGDLLVMEVTSQLMDKVKVGTKEPNKRNGTNKCAIISKNPEGLSVDYMAISRLQRKALDTITRYFEETGEGKQPISAAVKSVLTKARDRVSSPAR